MYKENSLGGVASQWQRERAAVRPPEPAPPEDSGFDPASWACSVCGKLRLRELLHSKAIQGQQQLVCAPTCLGAERRANAR